MAKAKYRFDDINTEDVEPDAENLAYALSAAVAVLASCIAGSSEQKKDEILRKFDIAVKKNEDEDCHTELAWLAQSTKLTLLGED